MKFTKATLASLTIPEGKSEAFYWDDDVPSFGIRLRGTSARWTIQYRVGAQQRRESLGDIRKVTLEAARQIARKRFAEVELGIDPGLERQKARAEASAVKLTLGIIIDRYLAAKQDVVRPATLVAAKVDLLKHWKPLHPRAVNDLKRMDVAMRVQEITAGSGRIAAARARRSLSAALSWGMREGIVEANVVIGTNDPRSGVTSRDRVLNDREIALVWSACQEDDFGRIVKLLLLSGCRRTEIGGLQWNEIDHTNNAIMIPAARSKNGRAHCLKLPEVAMDIIRSTPRRAGSDHVFGSRGFCAWSYSMAALRLRIGDSVPEWRIHDLRRSTRSGLSRIGVPPHIAERVLNHAQGKIESIYDRHLYENEVAEALAAWANHVAELVICKTDGGRREADGGKREQAG